ncbi:hypothetical protein HZS_4808, partial [Henneguya salminicola]
ICGEEDKIIERKYIYNIDYKHVAQQLCLIDGQMFCVIKWKELASIGWMKSSSRDIQCPNIVKMIKHSNILGNIVISDLIFTPELTKRVKALTYYIQLSNKLISMGNLNSSRIIVGALQNQAIYRLTDTWNNLKCKKKRMFISVKNFFDSTSTSEEYCKFIEKQLEQNKPLIPFLGIFLTRMVYASSINELNLIKSYNSQMLEITKSESYDKEDISKKNMTESCADIVSSVADDSSFSSVESKLVKKNIKTGNRVSTPNTILSRSGVCHKQTESYGSLQILKVIKEDIFEINNQCTEKKMINVYTSPGFKKLSNPNFSTTRPSNVNCFFS